jgi:hypothetical protein
MPPRKKATPPAAPSEPTEEFLTVPLGGQEFKMRPMNATQWAVLTKVTMEANRTNSGKANTRAVEVFFGVIERLLIDPDDVIRLEDAMVAGTVTVEDLSKAIEGERNGSAKPAIARTRRGQ